jgi:hypothetical protein
MEKEPIFIAHRGNTEGRNPARENHPDYIHEAISQGFDVEIDLWKIGSEFILGHDKPRHGVNYEFLLRKAPRLWIHAKDLQALGSLANDPRFNLFCHSNDPRVLTTKGYVWTRSADEDYSDSSIVLALDFFPTFSLVCGGICSNFPLRYRQFWQSKKSVQSK